VSRRVRSEANAKEKESAHFAQDDKYFNFGTRSKGMAHEQLPQEKKKGTAVPCPYGLISRSIKHRAALFVNRRR
jgi:hypothetical protein